MQQTTGATGQMKTATQPVEAPGAATATQPVEAPSAVIAPGLLRLLVCLQRYSLSARMHLCMFTADRLEVQPPGPASQIYTSGRSEIQPLNPTGQTATVLKPQATSLTGASAPADEPVSDFEPFSDHASSYEEEEGEVFDLESAGPDRERAIRCGPGTIC